MARVWSFMWWTVRRDVGGGFASSEDRVLEEDGVAEVEDRELVVVDGEDTLSLELR